MEAVQGIRFCINATSESVAAVFAMIIYLSCLIKKLKNHSRCPFGALSLNLFFLLTCNSALWIIKSLEMHSEQNGNLFIWYEILIVLDFCLYSFATICFIDYIYSFTAYVVEGSTEKTKVKNPGFMQVCNDEKELEKLRKRKWRIIHVLVAYTLLLTGLFASSLRNNWFFSFSTDGEVRYTFAYFILLVMSMPALTIAFIFIIKNRRLHGKKRTVLLLTFLIFPFIMLVVDRIFGLPISYVSLVVLLAAVYIEINLEQDYKFSIQKAELAKQEAELAKQETEKNEMKMHLMMSQVEPHFLFNTLSTVAYLCRKNPKEAEMTVEEFSDYLSGNLQSINTDGPIPFEKELQHVENYLKIQKRRFPQRVNTQFDIQTTRFGIPPLTLQTIVENVFKHSISKRSELTTLTIASAETDTEYIVTVKDDGIGFDTTCPPEGDRVHVGIANTQKRLEHMVGGRLEIISKIGVGTTVSIVIPKKGGITGNDGDDS